MFSFWICILFKVIIHILPFKIVYWLENVYCCCCCLFIWHAMVIFPLIAGSPWANRQVDILQWSKSKAMLHCTRLRKFCWYRRIEYFKSEKRSWKNNYFSFGCLWTCMHIPRIMPECWLATWIPYLISISFGATLLFSLEVRKGAYLRHKCSVSFIIKGYWYWLKVTHR